MPRKHRRNKNLLTETHGASLQGATVSREIPLAPLGWRAWLWVAIPVIGLIVYVNGFASTLGIDERTGRVTPIVIDATSGLGGLLIESGPLSILTFSALEPSAESARFIHHAVNLVIHILVALTLFGIVRRTLLLSRFRATLGEASPWIALVVALIWLVHPLQTETVTYVAQRSEALIGLFYLLVIYAVLRGSQSQSSGLWYGVAFVACALGMGCVGVMVTVPAVVLLFDRTFLSGSFVEALRKRRGVYVGMIFIVGAWIALATAFDWVGRIDVKNPASNAIVIESVESPSVYLTTQPGVVLHYLKLTAWPASLVFDYDWQPVHDPANALAPVLTIIALLLWTLWSVQRRRALGFLAAAFFLILLPTSSLIPLARPIAEHRMYLPLAPILIFAVVGVYLILRDFSGHKHDSRGRIMTGAVLALVAVCALSYKTIDRNRAYRNAETMWKSVIAQRPNNARAHVALASAALARGNYESADASLFAAVELDPNRADAWQLLGQALIEQHRFDEGIETLEHAMSLGIATADIYRLLGAAFKRTNNYEAAISSYSQSQWLDPDNADTYVDLGNIELELGDFNKALGYYDAALERDPNHIQAMLNKAAAFVEQNRFRDAIVLYDDVLDRDPDRETACESRAYVLSVLDGILESATIDAADGAPEDANDESGS